MRFSTKVLLSIVGAVALIVLAYQGYLTVRYRLHQGHREIISGHTPYEDGSAFVPLGNGASDVPGYAAVSESDALCLYVEEETGNIAIYDKRTDTAIYSVHPDMKDDMFASELNRSLQQSQVVVDFYTQNRSQVQWNSYDHAVLREQVDLESIENGVRVKYTIGDISSPTGIVPQYISLERLLEVLAPLEGTRDYNSNMRRYVESDVADGFMELSPSIRVGSRTIREMNEVFESVGYTAEDYAYDMESSGVEDAVPLHFVVPMDFILDGDSLIVDINTAGVHEYGGGRLYHLQIMRGFGAGSLDEDGYLVVPNGSGSLIYFNNGKTYADEYMQYIYGQDPMLSDYLTLGNTEEPRYPLFGIEAGTRTILGRIVAGDTQAYVYACIAEKYTSYNHIYPGFVLRGNLSLEMFGSTGIESNMPIIERDMPMMNLTVRYSMLEENGYSGMANYVRGQMLEEGMLGADAFNNRASDADDIPLYVDLIGSAMGQKFFAGIRYMGQIPMTTYEQAHEIKNDLSDVRNISNQVINYQGWYNRGYYHDVANKIKPVRQLGKTRELEQLARDVESGGGKLYSDVNMLGIPFSSRRYNWQLESSRYYAGGMVGYWGLVNPITYYNTFSLGYSEVMHDALSPRFLTRYMDKYIKEISGYDVTGTSLRDMGSTLVSDRRRTEVIHREQAREVIVYNMENLYNEGKPIMLSGGNMYALKYASDLINMPLSHNSLYIVDEEIPFYQMIIHGHINYAGAPINLSSTFDQDKVITRLIEYGASPHFTFTYESAGDVKYTGLNWMYGTRYANWADTAETIYHAVNDVLSMVSGAEIVSHEILPDGLRAVTYSNGVVIEIDRVNSEYSVIKN